MQFGSMLVNCKKVVGFLKRFVYYISKLNKNSYVIIFNCLNIYCKKKKNISVFLFITVNLFSANQYFW